MYCTEQTDPDNASRKSTGFVQIVRRKILVDSTESKCVLVCSRIPENQKVILKSIKNSVPYITCMVQGKSLNNF